MSAPGQKSTGSPPVRAHCVIDGIPFWVELIDGMLAFSVDEELFPLIPGEDEGSEDDPPEALIAAVKALMP